MSENRESIMQVYCKIQVFTIKTIVLGLIANIYYIIYIILAVTIYIYMFVSFKYYYIKKIITGAVDGIYLGVFCLF